jgi:hypothetical protein
MMNTKTMRDYLEIISGNIKMPSETPAASKNCSLLGQQMKWDSLPSEGTNINCKLFANNQRTMGVQLNISHS